MGPERSGPSLHRACSFAGQVTDDDPESIASDAFGSHGLTGESEQFGGPASAFDALRGSPGCGHRDELSRFGVLVLQPGVGDLPLADAEFAGEKPGRVWRGDRGLCEGVDRVRRISTGPVAEGVEEAGGGLFLDHEVRRLAADGHRVASGEPLEAGVFEDECLVADLAEPDPDPDACASIEVEDRARAELRVADAAARREGSFRLRESAA